ncbi:MULTISPECIES: MFS transporter [unclassified Campylobacter]|uniref:MFS transporter n=1 Tax=unclassified Campylobacter TaxID=2593542 RepID=UPI0012381FC2|nr:MULTISPECIES: MFS transporter [unclassified Campylobacter]KAA6225239.1 MFS transporter [Campylobacter sp. LR196d]KAA6226248.1 MFS transporter [Campylobacter sp. LR185c]KAA6228136.1 MFS transporter [Campylobacter sp. LR286c]KAA6231450.1 MFS transporter [Campylobacter sp. LR264d]KAA6231663.1 MFS transporter [Campylobacter sp. LR291e]
MKALQLLIIFTAMLTLALLYAPQPLMPLLASYFNVNLNQISWIMSIALIPLAISPLIYGYLLENFSLKKILIVSLFACAILQILGSLVLNFYIFLSLRFIQALFIPAILTSLLTLLTRIDTNNIQKNIAFYIGATTFGGFVGRIFGSYLSDIFSWGIALNFFAFLMLICAFSLMLFKQKYSNLTQKTSLKDYIPFFKQAKFIALFICIFTMFFAFQSITSFLPFHLKEVFKDITQTQIGLVYVSYLTGVLSSLLINKTIQILKSRSNTAVFGLISFIMGCFFVMVKDYYFSFFAMFVVCSGMFICHAIFSAMINLSTTKKGLANGLYLTIYYSGGALGSVLPGIYYQIVGWDFLCTLTASLLFCSLLGFLRYKKDFKL